MSLWEARASMKGSSVLPGFPKQWRTPSETRTSRRVSRPVGMGGIVPFLREACLPEEHHVRSADTDPAGAGRPLAPAAAGLEAAGGFVLHLRGCLVGKAGVAEAAPGAGVELVGAVEAVAAVAVVAATGLAVAQAGPHVVLVPIGGGGGGGEYRGFGRGPGGPLGRQAL